MQIQDMKTSEKILVLGAGELGMCVMRALSSAARGAFQLSVLLRPSDNRSRSRESLLEELQRLDAEVLYADVVADPIESLSEQFSRFDTLISCVGFVAGPGVQLKITQAALAAGVKRYVPWQFGVDYDAIGRGSPQDLFDEQLDVRDLLRGQHRTEWIIISTGMFTSFLFEPAFGVVDLERNSVHALGSWATEVTVTTPEDIGLLTAQILLAQPGVANQVLLVAGDTLNYAQLADTLDALLGRNLQRIEWTVAKLMDELARDPADPMKKYRAVFAQGKGVAWDKRMTYNARHGIALTTTAQWIAQNLAAGSR